MLKIACKIDKIDLNSIRHRGSFDLTGVEGALTLGIN
jgi:hypothetical protein